MPSPPHNPNLRDLVQLKRKSEYRQTREDGIQGFAGWHERGYLPHFDAQNQFQFVTFRLADSFSTSKLTEWRATHKLQETRERMLKIERYLDAGHGSCHLAHPEIAHLVENSFLCFDNMRYVLVAWVIMPNHIHAVVQLGTHSLSSIMESWKTFSAREANKILKRRGRFWAPDYWDTYIRNPAHLRRAIAYTENNPVKAGLASRPGEWKYSSARFRNNTGQLELTNSSK